MSKGRFRLSLATALLLGMTAFASPPGAALASKGKVNLYYAASLKALNEDAIGPRFESASGYTYQGFPNNSGIIVNELRAHLIQPDAVEFADASLNNQLMGDTNGNLVKWYVTLARTHLVIGFNPKGPLADEFKQAQKGQIAWYKPLLQSGLRFGRTDPNSDPKGYRTIFAFNLAQKLYHLDNLTSDVLGHIANPDTTGQNSTSPQVFPEATLVSQLLSGNLDAGIFYLPEVEAAGISYYGLPAKVSFGSSQYAKLDATQHYTNSGGVTITGSPTFYTVTIPSTVQDKKGAVAFVKFAISKRAQQIGSQVGLQSLPHTVYGDKKAVPKGIL